MLLISCGQQAVVSTHNLALLIEHCQVCLEKDVENNTLKNLVVSHTEAHVM